MHPRREIEPRSDIKRLVSKQFETSLSVSKTFFDSLKAAAELRSSLLSPYTGMIGSSTSHTVESVGSDVEAVKISTGAKIWIFTSGY